MKPRIRNFSFIFLALILVWITACGNDAGKTSTEKDKPSKTEAFVIDESKLDSEADVQKQVKAMMKKMSLEQKVGQLLMPDFRKWKDENVTVINDEIRQIVRDYHLGGIILFRENIVNRSQTKQLIDAFQKEAEIPLLVGVDQEGGLVTRLSFAPRMPGNMALGATGSTDLAKKTGLAIGSELRELGFNVDFGPVLDVNNNPDNPVIGVRSFGDDAETVTAFGIAFAKGLNEAGVAAVGKHFPGHGDVDMDSHYVLPSDDKTKEQLLQRELVPFKRLIDEGIQGIMTAHITFTSIETESVKSKKDGEPIQLPATLSPKIQTDILRNELGFKGVLFTDAMDMKAIADHFGDVDAAIRAIEAGNDIVLMPDNIQLVYDGILEAVKSKKLSEKRIDESVERVLLLKLGFAYNSENKQLKKMDIAEAIEIEQAVAKASVTLVEDSGILPFNENDKESVVVVATSSSDLSRLDAALKAYNWRTKSVLISSSANSLGTLNTAQKSALEAADKIVVATNILTAKDKEWQLKTLQAILNLDIPTVMIAAKNPYGMNVLKGYDAFIAQYDNGKASFEATGQVLYGKMEALGKLPVKLR